MDKIERLECVVSSVINRTKDILNPSSSKTIDNFQHQYFLILKISRTF